MGREAAPYIGNNNNNMNIEHINIYKNILMERTTKLRVVKNNKSDYIHMLKLYN